MVRARVIGYIPLQREKKVKTRIDLLLGKSMILLLFAFLYYIQILIQSNATLYSPHLDVTRLNGSSRLKKLAVAAKAFNHNDMCKHDSDVKQGAVAIVRSILRSSSMSLNGRSKEIQHCLQILLNLYRCSEERLCASYCTDGIIILDLLEIIRDQLSAW